MKLIWITPECPYPPNTGGKIGIWKRLEYLSQNNSIYLYSIIDSEDEVKYRAEMLAVCKEVKFYGRRELKGIWYECFRYPYPAVSRWNMEMSKQLEIDFDKFAPDLVIVDFPQMIGALPSNIIRSKKIVLNQHNIEHEAMRNIAMGIKNPIKKLIYRIVSKQLQKYEDNIYRQDYVSLYTFVSDSDKKCFEKKYNIDKTLLVPVGSEISDCEILENCHSLLFVGKMSYPANEEAAMWIIERVFPVIKESIDDARLFIIGKEPSDRLLRIASENDGIIVTGMVDDLDEYYSKVNLAVVPIMTGGGVNVKLLEAIGKNKVVVTTSKGIEGTNFEASKDVLVANDSNKFAMLCIDALNRPNFYEAIRQNAFLKIKIEYTWESIIKRFEKELIKMTKCKGMESD